MKEEFFDFDLYEVVEPKKTNLQASDSESSAMIFIYKEDHDAHKALLDKIISAIGLDVDAFDNIISLEKGELVNASSIATEKTSYIVSFGIAPSKLGFNASFKAYYTYKTETFKVLLSHSLQKLSDSKEHKMALWKELQKEFSKD